MQSKIFWFQHLTDYADIFSYWKECLFFTDILNWWISLATIALTSNNSWRPICRPRQQHDRNPATNSPPTTNSPLATLYTQSKYSPINMNLLTKNTVCSLQLQQVQRLSYINISYFEGVYAVEVLEGAVEPPLAEQLRGEQVALGSSRKG